MSKPSMALQILPLHRLYHRLEFPFLLQNLWLSYSQPSDVVARLNLGGNDYTDPAGLNWTAETGFTGYLYENHKRMVTTILLL